MPRVVHHNARGICRPRRGTAAASLKLAQDGELLWLLGLLGLLWLRGLLRSLQWWLWLWLWLLQLVLAVLFLLQHPGQDTLSFGRRDHHDRQTRRVNTWSYPFSEPFSLHGRKLF